jgi:hypothetical protein
MPRFERYIGVDYSGAETPTSGLKGLRVFVAEGTNDAVEERPAPSAARHWTRQRLAEWLVERLSDGQPTIVGIDHGFSFPREYFTRHGIAGDWDHFLEDFERHWPTREPHVYVDFVREGVVGDGRSRSGSARWRRLTERGIGAKSVFHFDVPGAVAKSTHAGLPWLRYLRAHALPRPHFWPFDGWEISSHGSVVVEVYPRLWNGSPRLTEWSADQHDAFAVAHWLWERDRANALVELFSAPDDDALRQLARIEGWIFGVAWSAVAASDSTAQGALDTTDAVERRQIAAWRNMTPAQKAKVVTGLTRTVYDLALAGIRARHPHAPRHEHMLRLAALIAGRDLAVKAYPEIATLEFLDR